jgi:acyl carrier protein
MSDDRARLMQCFAAVFPALPPEQIAEASPETVPAWDSIAHVTLMVVVEQEFGIPVAPEDMEHLGSFAALVDYVSGKTGRAPEPRAA